MPIDAASATLPSPMSVPRERAAREPGPPGSRQAAGRWQDALFERTTQFFAVFVLGTLVAIIVALLFSAWPAIDKFGFSFFTTNVWNPVTERLRRTGADLRHAHDLADRAGDRRPGQLRHRDLPHRDVPGVAASGPLGTAVELLAAVPSIIYGMWGLFVFAPLFGDYVQPHLTATLGHIPIIGFLFQGAPNGIGILTAGIILSIMVIPFIASVMRDVFEIVPPVLKESAYGIGATTWEVVWNVVLPYTKVGVIGGIMLGLGRALGETMAVTFVIGNAYQISAGAVRARQLDRLVARQRIQRGRRTRSTARR